VRIASRIVVVEADDPRPAQRLAILGLPFRLGLRVLDDVGRTVEIARRRDADAPQIVGVLLALDERDLAALLHRRRDLRPTIQRLVVDAFGVVDPAARSIWAAAPEALLTAGRIANLLKQQRAAGVDVIVGHQLVVVAALAAAFLRPGPSAMVTAPIRAVALDGDAETFGVFVSGLLPILRALRASRVVAARLGIRERDAVLGEQLGDGHAAASCGQEKKPD
jgi:hypothetical protein